MDVSTDIQIALTVAQVEFRRSVRAILGDRRQVAALSLAMLGFTPLLVLSIPGSYAVGAALAADEVRLSLTDARGQFVGAFLGVTTLGAIRGLKRSTTVEHSEFLLSMISSQALGWGLFLAEYLRTLATVGPIFALLYGAFLLGVGEPTAAIVALFAFALGLGSALAAGHAVGVWGRVVMLRLRIPDRVRRLLGLVGFVTLVIAVFIAGPTLASLTRSPPPELAFLPGAAYADLFLFGTLGPNAVGFDTVLSVAVIAVVPVVCIAATGSGVRRMWFSDSRERSRTRTESRCVPSPLSESELGCAVFWLWLRGVRAPSRFVHVLYVVFMALPLFSSVASADQPLLYLPPVVLVVGALFAGATFGLNPLGDAGALLPTIVLSSHSGTLHVRARIAAGLVVFLPAFLVAVAVGAVGPMTVGTLGLVAVFGVVLAVFSGIFAVFLGTLVPRFETEETLGVETARPTMWALFGHLTGIGGAAGVGFAAIAAPTALFGTESVASRVIPLAAVCGVFAVVGVAGYLYAVRRYETFSYD